MAFIKFFYISNIYTVNPSAIASIIYRKRSYIKLMIHCDLSLIFIHVQM